MWDLTFLNGRAMEDMRDEKIGMVYVRWNVLVTAAVCFVVAGVVAAPLFIVNATIALMAWLVLAAVGALVFQRSRTDSARRGRSMWNDLNDKRRLKPGSFFVPGSPERIDPTEAYFVGLVG